MNRHPAYLVILAALVGAGSASAADRQGAHNFVYLDLSWTPPTTSRSFSTALLDAGTASHAADHVKFDILTLTPVQGSHSADHSIANVTWSIEHHDFDCGWRTFTWVGESTSATVPRLLSATSRFNLAVDRLCANKPLGAAQGPTSIDAAANAWSGKFMEVRVGPGMAITTVVNEPRADTTWMRMDRRHGFEQVALDAVTGNTMYIDKADFVRDGDSVATLALIVLGAAVQLHGGQGSAAAALQSVRVDCARRTMTVVAQSTWDKYSVFNGASDKPFAARSAAESPVIAAAINMACTGDRPVSAQAFASVSDAWAHLRADLPPSTRPAIAACEWQHLSEESRNRYVAQQTMWDRKEELDVVMACNPGATNYQVAAASLAAYAKRIWAVRTLAASHVEESALLDAWRTLSWTDQLRLMRDQILSVPVDVAWQDALVARIAAKIGVFKPELVAALRTFLTSQAKLEDT